MPSLPILPDLPDDPYNYLVQEFGQLATERGLSGPAEAYIQWSMNCLLQFARNRAYADMEQDVSQMRETRKAEIDGILNQWTGG